MTVYQLMDPTDARILEQSPCYRIRRFYRETGRRPHTIRIGVTLAEAQEHCRRPETRGEGWFDGYDYMRGMTARRHQRGAA